MNSDQRAAARSLPRLHNSCLLKPSDISPSQENVEVIGVFNPGAVATDSGVVLMARVAEQSRERRSGYTALPRWDFERGHIVVDWEHHTAVHPVDIRVVKCKRAGCLVRLNFTSHLRIAHSRDGKSIDSIDAATFKPENVYEEYGVEDPRITRLGDTYYMTYVAVSRHGVATALASTRDFKSFQRHGIILPPENKDVVLFSEKINDRFCMLHRPNGATPFTRPEIWIAESPDLIHWGRHAQLLGGNEGWDIGRIGAGAPPLLMPEGWLEVYHGNSKREEDAGIGVYAAGFLLLDANNPARIMGRSGAVFLPETTYEREGYVPAVVFPTGLVDRGDSFLIYYGAADEFLAVVEFSKRDVLASLKP